VIPVNSFSQIRLLTSMLNRIQGTKPMRNHADPDPILDQTMSSPKVEFLHKKYTFGKE
jgi:hypothetical protein